MILCLIYEIALDGSTVNEDETVADEVEENEKIFQKIIIERKPADILG